MKKDIFVATAKFTSKGTAEVSRLINQYNSIMRLSALTSNRLVFQELSLRYERSLLRIHSLSHCLLLPTGAIQLIRRRERCSICTALESNVDIRRGNFWELEKDRRAELSITTYLLTSVPQWKFRRTTPQSLSLLIGTMVFQIIK